MNVPGDQHDPQAFLENACSRIHHKLVEEILSLKGVKFQLVLYVRIYKQILKGLNKWNEPTLRSKMEPLLTAYKIPEVLDRGFQHMLKSLEKFTTEASGWIVDGITRFQLHIACHQPMHSGSYLPSSKEVQNKKAVVSVYKTAAVYDGLCDRHSFQPSPTPNNSANTHQTNCVGMVPNLLKQINLVEKQNPKLAVNAFGRDKCVYPLRLSKSESPTEINSFLVSIGLK